MPEGCSAFRSPPHLNRSPPVHQWRMPEFSLWEAHLLNTLRTFRILGRWQGRCWHCTFSQTLKVRASVISVIFLIFVTQTFMIFHVSLDINAPSLWDPATVQDGSDWSFSTWGHVLKMPFWMLAHWIFVQLSIQQSQCGFCPSIQKILEESS